MFTMPSKIADFVTITDNPFTIAIGADIDRDYTFNLETGADLPSKAVLMFVFSSSSANSKLQVTLNSEVLNYTFNDKFQRNTIHEVIAGNKLKLSNNKIEFKTNQGSFLISDVILFYQRGV